MDGSDVFFTQPLQQVWTVYAFVCFVNCYETPKSFQESSSCLLLNNVWHYWEWWWYGLLLGLGSIQHTSSLLHHPIEHAGQGKREHGRRHQRLPENGEILNNRTSEDAGQFSLRWGDIGQYRVVTDTACYGILKPVIILNPSIFKRLPGTFWEYNIVSHRKFCA